MGLVPYSPTDHYWIVAGSTTQVWSSARMAYVPATDETYQAWRESGNYATVINSGADLYNVMLAQVAPAIMAGGVTVTSTATPALNGKYSVDATSIGNITALSTGIAAGKPLPGGGSSFNYPDAANAMHAFSSADFLDFAAAIEGYIYNFEQTLLTLLTGGTASMPAASLTIA